MGKLKYLFGAYVAFVIYGTLLPFHIVDSLQAVCDNAGAIRWLPFWELRRGRIPSIPDMVQNVILFLPVGILGAHCFRRKLVPTLFAGFGLSFLVETLQLLTPNRVTSANDLATNTIGTLIGFILSIRLMPFAAHAVHSPVFRKVVHMHGGVHLLALMLYIWVYALEPFNFTLNVGAVWWNVRTLLGQLAHPRLILRDEFILASQFALMGFVAAGFLKRLRIRPLYPLSLLLVAVWAAVTEMSQLIVASRVASVLTLCFSWFGAAIGVTAYDWQHQEPRKQKLLLLYGVFVLAGFAVESLSPFVLRESYLRPALLPFRQYQSAYFVSALSNIFHALLVFLPLGYLASGIGFDRLKRRLYWTVLFLALVAIELGQGFIAGRYPDVTDFFLPFGGAVIGWWVGDRVRKHAN